MTVSNIVIIDLLLIHKQWQNNTMADLKHSLPVANHELQVKSLQWSIFSAAYKTTYTNYIHYTYTEYTV